MVGIGLTLAFIFFEFFSFWIQGNISISEWICKLYPEGDLNKNHDPFPNLAKKVETHSYNQFLLALLYIRTKIQKFKS